MVFLRNSLLWSLFLGICLSCQKKDPDQGYTFLIPWPQASGEYRLQEVRLVTLSSPFEMKGSAAEVYSELGFRGPGLEGHPARPRLTEVDGVYVPNDPQSALVVAVYAHFEFLQKMEVDLQLPTRMSWPRQVSVGMPMVKSNGQREFNNARYFMDEDIVAVSPYNGEGLPLALNAGILAHEHFHAIFERLFMPAFESVEVAAESSQRRQLIVRAWNEGLADFYAFVYTQNPDYMGDSVSPEVRQGRRLDRDVVSLLTPQQFQSDVERFADDDQCPQGFCLAYGEGNKLARLLYEIWQKLSEADQTGFLRELLTRLPSASRTLASAEEISLRSLVPLVVSQQVVSKAEACKSLTLLLGGDEVFVSSYPECPTEGTQP